MVRLKSRKGQQQQRSSASYYNARREGEGGGGKWGGGHLPGHRLLAGSRQLRLTAGWRRKASVIDHPCPQRTVAAQIMRRSLLRRPKACSGIHCGVWMSSRGPAADSIARAKRLLCGNRHGMVTFNTSPTAAHSRLLGCCAGSILDMRTAVISLCAKCMAFAQPHRRHKEPY